MAKYTIMEKGKLFVLGLCIISLRLGFYSCQQKAYNTPKIKNTLTVLVNPYLFLAEGLAMPVSVVSSTLSDGTQADCNKIVIRSIPYLKNALNLFKQ